MGSFYKLVMWDENSGGCKEGEVLCHEGKGSVGPFACVAGVGDFDVVVAFGRCLSILGCSGSSENSETDPVIDSSLEGEEIVGVVPSGALHL